MEGETVSDKFTEALRHLGHIYEVRKHPPLPDRARHILKVYRPTGEIKARCGSEEPQGIGCSDLILDASCERCREIEGIPPALTKRGLMLDLVNILCSIEQQFLDAMSWNFHNPNEPPINPDPEGELAKGWLDNYQQLIKMMACFEPTMKHHEGRFSWPADLEEKQ
jgi:hypothetical protein